MIRRNCLLFFPASRPDLLDKALASGAERVCMDLEDAVPLPAKADARAFVRATLARTDVDRGRLVVRINHPLDDEGAADLAMLEGLGGARSPRSLVVPKIEAPAELTGVVEHLGARGDPSVIALIESARGLHAVEEIAAVDRVHALLFGALDMSADLGCALDWEALLYARSRTVHAAKLARIEAIDGPYFDIEDEGGLRAEADRGRRLGFTGKAAIHPRQVAVVDAAYAPSDDEVERARRVLEADARAGGGAHLVDGTMVDGPAVEVARRVLERAESRAEP